MKKYELCKILQSGLLLVPRSVQAQTNLDFVRVSFAYIYPAIWQQNHQPEYSSPKAGVAHNSKKKEYSSYISFCFVDVLFVISLLLLLL